MPAVLISDTTLLEEKLANASDPYLKIRYLNLLTANYVYVDPIRARALLNEQQALYTAGHPSDSDYFYYLHLGNLENQAYDEQKSLSALQKAVERVDLNGDNTDKIEVYLDYLGILVNLEMMEEARTVLEKSLRLLASYPSDRMRARLLCRQGYFYLNEHSHPKAIRTFLEANTLLSGESFDLTTKDHYVYTLVHSGLGALYTRPSSQDKAAEAFRLAIERCEEIGLSARLPWHRLNLGKVLSESGNYDEAIENFRSIISNRGNGSTAAYGAASVNLAMCYYSQMRPAEEVKELLDQAEEIFTGADKPKRHDLVTIDLTRAQLSIDEEDFLGAIDILQQTLEGIQNDPNGNSMRLTGLSSEICNILASCYAELEEFEYAYFTQKKSEYFLDSYYEQQGAEQQERFAAQFEAEVREKERESLQLRASQLQLRALRAQMNPHFLYNALNSIQSFITSNEASTASKYLAKFAMLMRRSLEYSNREYIILDDEVSFLKDYLDINCHLRFEGKLTYEVDIHPELEEDILGVPTMILQPYVENAIEHGLRTRPKGHIEVRFIPIAGDDDNILATVTDDGIGRVRTAEIQAQDVTRQHHQSRGTEITLSRLELLTDDPRNRVVIDDLYHKDGNAAGTQVTVRVPVTDVLPRQGQA